MRSAVTVSLVPEARGGPFVFHDSLPAAAHRAAELGFDAVELFLPGPDFLAAAEVKKLLAPYGLAVAAVGTGAGWLRHKYSLTNIDSEQRALAVAFVRDMIDWGGQFGAPAIIGSMQGRFSEEVPRDAAFGHLTDALLVLGDRARRAGTTLIYEPLNRYETNLVNRLADGVSLVADAGGNVKLLADLFHMNIEEVDLPAALTAAGPHVGHVHLADSNRRPAGLGHTDFAPIGAALKAIGYDGYVSAEAFPYPDADAAAAHTMTAFRKHFV